MEKCKGKMPGTGQSCVKPCGLQMGSGVAAHISVPLLMSLCGQQAGQEEACRPHVFHFFHSNPLLKTVEELPPR